MKKTVNVLFAVMLLVSCGKANEARVLGGMTSPDGKLSMSFLLTDNGTPQYSLKCDDTDVVLPSSLGFEMRGVLKATEVTFDKDGKAVKYDSQPCFSMHDGFSVTEISTSSFDETWTPVWGEESCIRNNYNELFVAMEQPAGKDGRQNRLNIRFRLFNDGLAFRYEFPANQKHGYMVIKDELSEFRMAVDCTAWWIVADYDSQEYEYTKSRLSEISSLIPKAIRDNSSRTYIDDSSVQTSLQMKMQNGLYVNIHEAALVDYPCMHLTVDGRTHTLVSSLTPGADGWKGQIQTPCHTPWRTVQVARRAADQLESRMVLNLNEPCALEDVSWIHPTKYMGVWWEMIAGASTWDYTRDFQSVKLGESDYSAAKPHGRHGANNEKVREYIDFAAENGFDQLLIEGWNIGWEDWANCNKDYVFDFVTPYPDFDIAALNDYAHKKGIKLMMHHETSSSPRNYERHMEAAYSLMDKYGYDAVKSGYVGNILPEGQYHYSQWMVNHYLYALKEAAKHHIMVNAHEAVRPTGLCRTYPNLVGNESAMGTEYQAFGGIKPGHTAILPFTRLNGGPMDYTPGIFEMDLKSWCGNDSHVNSTICGQLGLYLTMYSPLQMAADTPEHYRAHMDAFQFIKDVPCDWSESVYIDAEPMEYIIVARKGKKDGKWYLGGVTDGNAREFDIKLGFLGEGSHTAVIYADAADADCYTNEQAYEITTKTVTADDTLKVRMAPGGGFAVQFK